MDIDENDRDTCTCTCTCMCMYPCHSRRYPLPHLLLPHTQLHRTTPPCCPPSSAVVRHPTPFLGAGHARNDLQRHRQFEALIHARFDPAQERARRPRRPQGPGVANTPHTPKPHTRTTLALSTTTTTQSKIAPPGIVGKGAKELISAEEDAAQVAEAVGRERTSAC